MARTVIFERVGEQGTTRGTLPQLEQGTNNVVSRLPHYDLLSFLAILENMPSLRLFDFMPKFEDGDIKRGLSGVVHSIAQDEDHGVIFKRFQSTHASGINENKVDYQALISEVIVLEHPVFKSHPNLPKLGGITWDVEMHNKTLTRAMPTLIFKRSKFGDLREFLASQSTSQLSFPQRMQFCIEVGRAIEALHTFSTASPALIWNTTLIRDQVLSMGISSLRTY